MELGGQDIYSFLWKGGRKSGMGRERSPTAMQVRGSKICDPKYASVAHGYFELKVIKAQPTQEEGFFFF